jgi:hypothetical protein
MKNKGIKVKTKKMMAYPLNEDIPDQYELCKCEHCKSEYLSQCEIVEETTFCPLHTNYEHCYSCEKTFSKKEMQTDNDEDFYCNDCFQPKCIECGEPIDTEEDARFCSQQCYNDYWVDLDEDEHKNR